VWRASPRRRHAPAQEADCAAFDHPGTLTAHVLARKPLPTAEAQQPSAEQLQRAQASREAALRVRAQNASRPAASHGAGAPTCSGQPLGGAPPPNRNPLGLSFGPAAPTVIAPLHQQPQGLTQVQADRVRESHEAAKSRRGEVAGEGGSAPVAGLPFPALNVSRDAAAAFKSPRFVAATGQPGSVRYPLS
jgi:hypothetical protein